MGSPASTQCVSTTVRILQNFLSRYHGHAINMSGIMLRLILCNHLNILLVVGDLPRMASCVSCRVNTNVDCTVLEKNDTKKRDECVSQIYIKYCTQLSHTSISHATHMTQVPMARKRQDTILVLTTRSPQRYAVHSNISIMIA